jgi:perosamine synthetase
VNIPLSRPMVDEEMKNQVLAVLDSRRFVAGPRVEKFEDDFSNYCGVTHATAVSSGTAAIYLALKALDIRPGDKVACPSLSFIATATPILHLGAEPVFVDVGDDYNMDMADLARKLTPEIKCVIVVHLYGQIADMEKLLELKKKHGFFLIEDACQAHGAEYIGKKSGSFGDIACFSFYPSKNMTVAGDGGMVLTKEKELDIRLKAFRNHGIIPGPGTNKYLSNSLGFNFRMSEISAAIGIVQLRKLDQWIDARRRVAGQYHQYLPKELILPWEQPGRKHAFHLYVIRNPNRDKLRNNLLDDGIETGIHYPIPIHRQPPFSMIAYLPNTDRFCQQVLSLPMFPELSFDEVRYICTNIGRHLAG